MSFTRSAAVYARISDTQGEQDREGVWRQVQDALERITSLPGVELNARLDGSPVNRKQPELGYWPAGVFVDNDISARKGSRKKRPEYDRMMAHVLAGDANMIVCAWQNRLWRNNKQRVDALSDLRDLDVRLHFLKGSEIDLSRPGDKLMVGVIGEFDAYYGDEAAAKQRDATRHGAKAGAYHGARPFGFRLAHVNPDGAVHPAPPSVDRKSGHCPACEGRKASRYRTLVPDPAEAEAVRQAYRLADAGISLYAICQYLDGSEIDGPDGTRISRPAIPTAGGKRWEDVGVASLIVVLRAKRNIGKREHSAGWEGGKRPPGELHDAHWDAIVDEPLFDAVQKILDGRRKVRPGGSEPAHLLTGYAYGGFCGHRLRIHKVNGKRRYACGAWKTSGQCVSFEAEPAEVEVERYLFKWLARNTMLTKALEHTGNADLQKLYARRQRFREQRDELADKLSDDVIDDETYKRLKARKDDQIAEVNGDIDALLDSGAASPRDRKDFPTGAGFRAEWRNADLEGKRVIVRRFIDKVDIYPAGAGNAPDPRLIRIHPGSWARGIESAQPSAAPDPASFSSKGRILTFIREHPGEWFTREAISTGTGISPTATAKVLTMLGLAGDVAREWRHRGGQRACFMYSAASGESWGPRTRNAPGGVVGAREKIRAFMESDPNAKSWFTAAEIGAGSGAGDAPHVTRTLNELIAAGFAQRRRAPLPRKDVRYQYSINGR